MRCQDSRQPHLRLPGAPGETLITLAAVAAPPTTTKQTKRRPIDCHLLNFRFCLTFVAICVAWVVVATFPLAPKRCTMDLDGFTNESFLSLFSIKSIEQRSPQLFRQGEVCKLYTVLNKRDKYFANGKMHAVKAYGTRIAAVDENVGRKQARDL
jgi:hypothetical protein